MTTDGAPSKAHYEQRAKEGYGLMYPDGHIIRVWEHILKDRIGDAGGRRMLDFGCWNGTHTAYFGSKGFQVAGVDIVGEAVRQASERNKGDGNLFCEITDSTSLDDLFEDPFDLVFANQVLYFLSDEVLSRRLAEFERLLKPGGYVVFTMMTRRNYFSRYSAGVRSDGLEVIRFPSGHRFEGKETYVRFMESPGHVESVFCRFERLALGLYDFSLTLDESSEHYIFVGQRREAAGP